MSRHHRVLATAVLAALSTCFVPSVSAADTETKAEKVNVFDKGQMTVPESFERTEPQSRIIEHEFKVGEGDSTARLTMMGAGGGVEANIKRWQGQFSGGDAADQKTEKIEAGKWTIHLVDASGSYAERMGGGPFFGGKTVQREDYAMAGAILAEPEGRLYFAKMIGPADVVKKNRDAFVKMVKSIAE
ncbi:hypothetical protein FYK55_20500 [Roseiconus nitratireducens]|uniref:Secreted protein n=1 Tax=Roseiconus nitratireducens TaxID=2605748 RepID=A0A5M6D3U4_9BACT|nr:hypothetical protein [Roseiconus nitratireducens]KAA5540399.1 hypothetical protein FYK55_20500 [Roseiconus nitratireducens]